MKKEFTHPMNVDDGGYEGFKVEGWSEVVLSRGWVVVDEGQLAVEGGGSDIKRARCGELLR